MRNRTYETADKTVIPDSVHGRFLPYPIRSFLDEENAFIYFLARYKNYFTEYEKMVSRDELWNIKAELLAIVHSFSTADAQPECSIEECVSTIDAYFSQIYPRTQQVRKGRMEAGLGYAIRY